MKEQSKDLGSVKAYLDDKGDQAAARGRRQRTCPVDEKDPDVFPPGSERDQHRRKIRDQTGDLERLEQIPGGAETAAGKADVLLAAIKSGDKATIQTAFGDLGKNGCGACHDAFREKLKD